MKKIIAMLVCVLMLAACLPTAAFAVDAGITTGDVNGDEAVDVKDVVLMIRFLTGWDVGISEEYGDFDGNGRIDMRDLILLIRYILSSTPEPEPEPDYRLIGEVFATYIMAERDNEMLLIDKHAAHERILFNRLKRQHQSGAVERQVLLVPLTIHMPRELYDAAIKNLDCFERAGFAAEDFGEGCLRVREVPTILEDIPAEDLLTELCERLLHRGGMDEEAIYDELYHSVACKAAIKGNIPSMEREQQELLQLLREDPTVRNCPHGRPVAIVITRRELERMFGRIV